jgi:hypothetical protein
MQIKGQRERTAHNRGMEPLFLGDSAGGVGRSGLTANPVASRSSYARSKAVELSRYKDETTSK